MDRRALAHVLRRARAVTAAAGFTRAPVRVEHAAARCGIREIRRGAGTEEAARLLEAPDGSSVLALDPRIPPRTPQWNGLVALAAARMLLPPGVAGSAAQALAEIGASELLLPARVFSPIAARTDLTLDGLKDLARRFSATIRLTICQWLQTGTWSGFALLWRQDGADIRLSWRAVSPGLTYPPGLPIGARAVDVWHDCGRLNATLLSGRPHHGLEEVSTGRGTAWWFTRFGMVRDEGARAALALVVLERRGTRRPRLPEGMDSVPANRGAWAGQRSLVRRGRGAWR